MVKIPEHKYYFVVYATAKFLHITTQTLPAEYWLQSDFEHSLNVRFFDHDNARYYVMDYYGYMSEWMWEYVATKATETYNSETRLAIRNRKAKAIEKTLDDSISSATNKRKGKTTQMFAQKRVY